MYDSVLRLELCKAPGVGHCTVVRQSLSICAALTWPAEISRKGPCLGYQGSLLWTCNVIENMGKHWNPCVAPTPLKSPACWTSYKETRKCYSWWSLHKCICKLSRHCTFQVVNMFMQPDLWSVVAVVFTQATHINLLATPWSPHNVEHKVLTALSTAPCPVLHLTPKYYQLFSISGLVKDHVSPTDTFGNYLLNRSARAGGKLRSSWDSLSRSRLVYRRVAITLWLWNPPAENLKGNV